ncbi:hypothetical protein HOG21_05900 [bacterium]|nr:hypothetical protein [bacterium]
MFDIPDIVIFHSQIVKPSSGDSIVISTFLISSTFSIVALAIPYTVLSFKSYICIFCNHADLNFTAFSNLIFH